MIIILNKHARLQGYELSDLQCKPTRRVRLNVGHVAMRKPKTNSAIIWVHMLRGGGLHATHVCNIIQYNKCIFEYSNNPMAITYATMCQRCQTGQNMEDSLRNASQQSFHRSRAASSTRVCVHNPCDVYIWMCEPQPCEPKHMITPPVRMHGPHDNYMWVHLRLGLHAHVRIQVYAYLNTATAP